MVLTFTITGMTSGTIKLIGLVETLVDFYYFANIFEKYSLIKTNNVCFVSDISKMILNALKHESRWVNTEYKCMLFSELLSTWRAPQGGLLIHLKAVFHNCSLCSELLVLFSLKYNFFCMKELLEISTQLYFICSLSVFLEYFENLWHFDI